MVPKPNSGESEMEDNRAILVVECAVENHPEYDLTKGRKYEVVEVNRFGWYRLADNSGDLYLYPAEMFNIVEPNANNLNPCRCCGHWFIVEYNSFKTCPVCGWTDDEAQYKDLYSKVGANKMSLYTFTIEWKRQQRPVEKHGKT